MSVRDFPPEELARAIQAAEVRGFDGVPLASDCCFDPELASQAQAIAEAAQERAAIAAEGAAAAASPGLVQTPTALTRAVGGLLLTRRTELRDAGAMSTARAAVPVRKGGVRVAQVTERLLDAFRPDPNALRLMELRKQIGMAAYGHVANPNKGGDDVLMLTLTYAKVEDWRPNHIREALQRIRMQFKRNGWPMRYVWVAELQKRGATHYHVALWVPRGAAIPFADDRGWWQHGMTKTERVQSVVGYLMAYLKKGKDHQKDYSQLPKGARAYGVGGLLETFKRCRRWLRAPTFIRRTCSIDDGAKRAPGGGWLVPDRAPAPAWLVELCGPTVQALKVVPSEFARVWVGVGYALTRVHRHSMEGAMPEGVGPFSWWRAGAPFAASAASEAQASPAFLMRNEVL